MIKNIVLFILIIVGLVFQISFFSNFPFLKNNLNIILFIVMYLMLTRRFKIYLFWIILVGWLADLFSGFGFGTLTLSLLIAAVLSYFLYTNYFSHRTSLSLIVLMAVISLCYFILIGVFSNIFYFFNVNQFHVIFDFQFIIYILRQTFFNSLFFILIYLLFNNVVKKIREQFIIGQ